MARSWSLSELARRRPVVRNAAALALTASAARVFDAGYRVVVARFIGPETVGLLQMAGSVYAFALGLATLGLSPALARLIATLRAGGPGRRRTGHPGTAERQAVATATALAGPAGVATAVLLAAAAPWIAHRLLSDPRVVAPLRVLAFGLIPAAFCGVLRGRFQGAQQMLPLAVAQFIEPVIRLGVSLFALLGLPALWSVPVPFPPAVLLAGFAVVGESAECLFLAGWQAAGSLWQERRTDGRGVVAPARFSPPVAAQLLHSAVPIMLSQFFFAAVAMADAGLIPRLLVASGLTPAQATRDYGLLH
ncbi:MAG TPA: oligosaccharide flippase family protein, partial [Firmicutes bacterium]|nr:oligosaccharide flippase family protein [Bacillota bacterium]